MYIYIYTQLIILIMMIIIVIEARTVGRRTLCTSLATIPNSGLAERSPICSVTVRSVSVRLSECGREADVLQPSTHPQKSYS